MRLILPAVVFSCGAIVMILELAASRIIAPYLGTSLIIWTSLIGVILACLACGNWLGGRIADKYPKPETLAGLLLGASLSVAISTQFQSLLAFMAGNYGLQMAAIMSILILFGPATVILGTIAPMSVKLSLLSMERAGRLVGNLYALSNAGSIVGTFLGGFVLISLVGSTRIITLLAVALAGLAFLVVSVALGRKLRWFGAGAGALALALVPHGGLVLEEGSLLADVDTPYSRTWVVDENLDGYTVRTLRNSLGAYQSGILLEHPDTPLFDYIRLYDAFEAFNPAAKRGLMLGGSGYTYPRYFLSKDTERSMTVIEIDPGVTELAREYFFLADDPRMEIVHEDARTYLNRANEDYDVIFVDAFTSANHIPFHLTTREAVERMAANLTDDGIVLTNIISSFEGPESGFLAAEYATYKEVFPHVRLLQVDATRPASDFQNIMLIASRVPLEPADSFPFAEELEKLEWIGSIPSAEPLTDDFAPVEKFTRVL